MKWKFRLMRITITLYSITHVIIKAHFITEYFCIHLIA